MTLTVEDGSGLANADSYLAVADADTYWASHGNPSTWTSGVPSTAAKEQALRLATQYLDLMYASQFNGIRASIGQSLEWPRQQVRDLSGYYVPVAPLPTDLLSATAEIAFRSLTDTLIPDIANPASVKSDLVKVGSIEIANTYAGAQSQIKRYGIVDALLQRRNLIPPSGVVQRS